MFAAADRFGAVPEPVRASVPQQAKELLGGVANGADVRRRFPLVDIPADDAFPPLRHWGKLYQSAAGPGGISSHAAPPSTPGAKPEPGGRNPKGDETLRRQNRPARRTASDFGSGRKETGILHPCPLRRQGAPAKRLEGIFLPPQGPPGEP